MTSNVAEPVTRSLRVLAIGTVTQSLALQAPAAWDVLLKLDADITFAAAPDSWAPDLARWGDLVPLPSLRPSDGSLASRPVRAVSAVAELRSLLTRSWDLVQVQSPVAAWVARACVPTPMPYPVLYIAHGLHFHHDGRRLVNEITKASERSMLARTTGLGLVAAEDFAYARKHWSSRCAIFRLPGAGVDVDAIASTSPIEQAQPYVMFCGELNANKAPLEAIAYVAEAHRRLPSLRMVVVGDGPLRGQVAKAARRLPWLDWLPRTREVPALLRGASALIAPSRREGLPRVVIEALAAGTPVVARSNRGTRELLPATGCLVPDQRLRSWRTAIVQTIRTPPDAATLQAVARRYDVDHFHAAYATAVRAVMSLHARNAAHQPAAVP